MQGRLDSVLCEEMCEFSMFTDFDYFAMFVSTATSIATLVWWWNPEEPAESPPPVAAPAAASEEPAAGPAPTTAAGAEWGPGKKVIAALGVGHTLATILLLIMMSDLSEWFDGWCSPQETIPSLVNNLPPELRMLTLPVAGCHVCGNMPTFA
jgi:hypothetical protein